MGLLVTAEVYFGSRFEETDHEGYTSFFSSRPELPESNLDIILIKNHERMMIMMIKSGMTGKLVGLASP